MTIYKAMTSPPQLFVGAKIISGRDDTEYYDEYCEELEEIWGTGTHRNQL